MKKIIIQNLKVALAFFSFLFIVGLILRFQNINSETIIWTAKITATITLGFTIFMGLYQVLLINKYKLSLSDFDIQPTQSATFIIDKTIEETKEIVENIIPSKINSSRFRFDNELCIYEAKTRTTIQSWGEIIIIKLAQFDNCKTEFSILSKSALRTTLIDYGKSSLNIHKIKLALKQNGL